MDLLFRVKYSENTNSIPIYNNRSKCKISTKNAIAFYTNTDIDCPTNFSFKNRVFVCDLLSPWNIYEVYKTNNVIRTLEWNTTGELLLIVEGGCVKLWKCRAHTLNSWRLAYEVNLNSEIIINCKFFHNGKKLYFNTFKRDSPIYAEKFEKVKSSASLHKFGKVSAEGCVMLTSSGLICAFFLPTSNHQKIQKKDASSDGKIELKAVVQSLGLVRNYIEHSTIASNNGNFRIATYGTQEKILNCFDIKLNLFNNGNLIINKKSLPAIFLSGGFQRQDNFKITQIQWYVIDSDIILISYNNDYGSIIEQWNLISSNKPVHKFLQKNKVDVLQCEYWEHVARYHVSVQQVDICLSKNLFDNRYIYLLLGDNSIHILETGLKKIGSINMAKYFDEKQNISYITFDITTMNHILILLCNTGDIHAVQVCNRYIDMKTNEILSLQVSLLEYCVITGLDATDILLFQMNSLETLIEKLSDNFMRQPPFVRQYYYSNFLALKSNMCRMHSKQNDFDNLIILHSISIAFKSLLRPSDLVCHDKGPVDNLSIVLSDGIPDVDKVLFNLDAKDFTVEPLTLQSLQQLIQWVADLAFNILNKLPEDVIKKKFCKKQCYEISKDSVALNNIRELLAMIRIWGLLNAQCLPVYTKSIESIDVLGILFRLLSRLAQNPNEPDEMLLDECVILSTQVLVSGCHIFNNRTLINTQNLGPNKLPLNFKTLVEPIGDLQEIPVEKVIYPSGKKDGVCNVVLGRTPKLLKECLRCGFFNESNSSLKTPIVRAWCARWTTCRCGGFWKNMEEL